VLRNGLSIAVTPSLVNSLEIVMPDRVVLLPKNVLLQHQSSSNQSLFKWPSPTLLRLATCASLDSKELMLKSFSTPSHLGVLWHMITW
jgi:hypothetical protein